MAIMIPEKPREIDVHSKEDIMFEALSKLPDDYYVFHSFTISLVEDDTFYESEADFIIFNQKKGIICLEAKAGGVKYERGCWRYSNGIIMRHDGPYSQASGSKWKLINYIRHLGLSYLLDKCKMMHAVWFPQVSFKELNKIKFPSEADKKITLTSEALDDIKTYVDKIYAIKLPNVAKTNLSNEDTGVLLNNVLAPHFNLISIADSKISYNKYVFKKLLNEQVSLLNYLEEQRTAVVNGLAGTGKTIMALKKAEINAGKKEKVLFLCFNNYLKKHLQELYNNEYIDFYTIGGLACKLCDSSEPDYEKLKEVLFDMYVNKTFPYKHIIIDEGQDFGREDITESDIIEHLKLNVLDSGVDGSFYLFYDKNQLIQSEVIPEYIVDADCKLTLYKNCRNTENIAVTSFKFLNTDLEPKLYDGSITGDSPEMYFATDESSTAQTINTIIDDCKKEGYDNIQILTCKTDEKSILKPYLSEGNYVYDDYKIPFTTCRKFKGLEADVVILVDLDEEVFSKEYEKIVYVGSSRARFKLELIVNLTKANCKEILKSMGMKKVKDPERELANIYNSKYKTIK